MNARVKVHGGRRELPSLAMMTVHESDPLPCLKTRYATAEAATSGARKRMRAYFCVICKGYHVTSKGQRKRSYVTP